MLYRKGIALITVLLFIPLLLIMVLSLLTLAGNNSFAAKQHLDEAAAIYVAEDGLSAAMVELENDPAWEAGFNDQFTHFERGSYTIEFGPGKSINNLTGATPIVEPNVTVPPHSAYLKVQGRVSGTVNVVEAMVSNRVGFLSGPLMASGPVVLRGKVSVDGLDRVGGAPQAAGIHSNYKGSGPVISWEPNGGTDRAEVSGKVSTVDPDADSLDFGSDSSLYQVDEGFETDAPPQAYEDVDVKAVVGAHSGAPTPTLGTSSATVGAGRWYVDGTLTINGDLTLQDGAELYVSGGLTVNGAVRGDGSVFVSEDTRLQGDAFISSSNHLALFSGGDVNLIGFNGTQYIRSLGPAASQHLDNINATIDTMVTLIDSQSPSTVMGNVGPLDRLKHQIAARSGDSTYQAMSNNQLGDLKDIVSAQPPGPTRDFLLNKFSEYYDFFYWQPGQDLVQGAADFIGDPSVYHDWALQSVFDLGAAYYGTQAQQVLNKVRYVVSGLGYDRAGDSYFQGLVYSNGDIHAENGLTVMGALVTDGRNGKLGKVELLNDVDLIMIDEFFSDPDRALAGPMYVKAWSR